MWNGTFLGVYKSDIIRSTVLKQDKYFRLSSQKFDEICIYRNMKTYKHATFACIVDELKPIFGLMKLGTHSIKIGTKYYMLIKPCYDGQIIIEDKKLECFVNFNNENFREKIRNIFVFRDLLDLKPHHQNTVRIRKINNRYHPVSFIDNDSNNSVNYNSVTDAIVANWLDPYTFEEILKNTIIVSETRHEQLYYYREKIKDVILAIDKSHISFAHSIIAKLGNYI